MCADTHKERCACERAHEIGILVPTQHVHGYPVCGLRHSLGRAVSLNLGVAMSVLKKIYIYRLNYWIDKGHCV